MSKVHSLVSASPLPVQEIYGGLLSGFETWPKTNREQRRMNKRLSKGNQDQRELGLICEKCREAQRCGSGGCKKCLKKAREQLIPQVSLHLQRVLRRLQSRARKNGKVLPKLWAVSAADARQAVPRGSLGADAVIRKTEAVSKAIERSALCSATVYGGIDVSLNLLLPKGSEPVWQPHYYLLIVATSDRTIHSVLDPLFPPAQGTRSIPVHVEEVKPKDIPYCVSYGFKAEFTRRESYKGPNGRTQTAHNRLKANEKGELALFLHQLGIKHRFLLRGLKITKGRVIRTKLLCPQHKGFGIEKDVVRRVLGANPGLFRTSS